jgi:hypothetical protein
LNCIDRDLVGTCYSDKSPFYLHRPQRGGNCPEWDAFDIDVALEVMGDINS